VDLEFDNSTK